MEEARRKKRERLNQTLPAAQEKPLPASASSPAAPSGRRRLQDLDMTATIRPVALGRPAGETPPPAAEAKAAARPARPPKPAAPVPQPIPPAPPREAPSPKPVPLPNGTPAPAPTPVKAAGTEAAAKDKTAGKDGAVRVDAAIVKKAGPDDAAKPDAETMKANETKVFVPLVPLVSPEAEEPDDVKVYVPKSTGGQTKHTERNATESAPSASLKAAPARCFSLPEEEENDFDQIQLDGFLDAAAGEKSETADENAEPDEGEQDWEERLQEERRKKAENFKLHPPVGLKLSGEEEENDPAEEPEVFEDDELEDFNSYEETEAVRNELNYRRRTGWLQLILTGVIAVVLLGVSAALNLFQLPTPNAALLVSLNLFLLGVAALINHRAVGGGVAALFRLKANVDSVAGLSTAVVLLHTAAQFLNMETVASGRAVILAPVAALGLFLNSLGRQMLLLRISRNFQFVSYRGEKYAARIVEDSRAANEIGRSAVAIGEPVVCYLEKTGFLTRFLENSYDGDAGDRAMKLYVPISLAASAVLAVIYGLASRSGDVLMNSITVFASAVCLSSPLATLSSTNFPMLRAAGRALRRGAMLIGWKAAEEFGGSHALAVDALDLFPSESVLLHGIKTFSGTRIDEAILDAAAVSIAAGGPLSSVFRRVIQDRTDILQDVDTLVYEQDMGMSGWVGGRRVLIGNRRLLENHGVDVPSRDYEARYARDHRQLVYLSTAGELSAMFVVSYIADEGIMEALDALTGAGVTLLVRTCDPNVTEDMVCRVFDLDPYYVEIMGAPAGRRFEQLADESREENEAVMASNGRLEGIAYALTYCRRLRGASRLAVASQVIGGAIGFAMGSILFLYGGMSSGIPGIFLVAYSLLCSAVSWVLPCIRRV